MNFALINADSRIDNIIVANQEFADAIKSDWSDVVDLTDHPTAKIGDVWNGDTFTTPQPDIELQWASVRSERDQKLQTSDWTQLADVPLSEILRAAWTTYRQALRDITTQPDPFALVWPTAPDEESAADS